MGVSLLYVNNRGAGGTGTQTRKEIMTSDDCGGCNYVAG